MAYVKKDWTLKEQVEVDNFDQVAYENMVEIYNRLSNVPRDDSYSSQNVTMTASWQDLETISIRSRGGILLVMCRVQATSAINAYVELLSLIHI